MAGRILFYNESLFCVYMRIFIISVFGIYVLHIV